MSPKAAPIRLLDDPVRHHASRRPAALALTDERAECTWAELDRAVSRVANALIASGVAPGDRVALFARDSILSLETALGVARARAVLVPLNWRLTAAEVQAILEDAGARLLLATVEFAGMLAAVDGPRTMLLDAPLEAAFSFRAAVARAADEDPMIAADPEDLVALNYTSGTTGKPKGVMLPHRSYFAIRDSLARHRDAWIGWSERDRVHSALPFFHIGGSWWTVGSLLSGSETHLLGGFVPEQVLDLFESRAITKTCMVPSMIHLLSEAGAKRPDAFVSLQTVVYGGAPIPESQLVAAQELFGCEFAQIYGLTETGNTAVCLRPGDHRRGGSLLRAAGRPYPGVEVKVLDGDGRELGPGETGEICLRSPANMLGYLNAPEATAATLREGWIHTGDGGHVDAEGYVFVSDRIKDLIICAGENVFPAEIESALCAHAGVREAAVIGLPDARWGETVHAVVVPVSDGFDRLDVLRSLRGRLASYKIPRTLVVRDQLPRTASGKIQKHVLRAELAAHANESEQA